MTKLKIMMMILIGLIGMVVIMLVTIMLMLYEEGGSWKMHGQKPLNFSKNVEVTVDIGNYSWQAELPIQGLSRVVRQSASVFSLISIQNSFKNSEFALYKKQHSDNYYQGAGINDHGASLVGQATTNEKTLEEAGMQCGDLVW
jgi:hypothetical protein